MDSLEYRTETVKLLESARSICARKGQNTSWERFDNSIAALGISNITPREYKLLEHERRTAHSREALIQLLDELRAVADATEHPYRKRTINRAIVYIKLQI